MTWGLAVVTLGGRFFLYMCCKNFSDGFSSDCSPRLDIILLSLSSGFDLFSWIFHACCGSTFFQISFLLLPLVQMTASVPADVAMDRALYSVRTYMNGVDGQV